MKKRINKKRSRRNKKIGLKFNEVSQEIRERRDHSPSFFEKKVVR